MSSHARPNLLIDQTRAAAKARNIARLPGPAPSFFFAPEHLRTLHHGLGGDVLDARIADSWRSFRAVAAQWIDIARPRGADEIREAYLDILDDRADPATGCVCSMWP